MTNTTHQDYNPFEERAWIEFEQPKPKWWQRFSVQAVPPSVLVVDLSHYNAEGHCDFAKIKASGVVGVVLKCSESDYYKDTSFEYSWEAALGEGLAVMVYHFFRSHKTDEVQYSWFMSCAENFLKRMDGNVAVAADVETTDGTDKDTRAARFFGLCRRWREAGLKDGGYSSPGLVSTLFPKDDSRWNALTFQWVAHWTSAADYTLPNGWDRNKVVGWQFGIYPTYSWCPKVEGAGNAVDVNRFFFPDAAALKLWLGQDGAAPPAEYPMGIVTNKDTVERDTPGDIGSPVTVIPENTGLVAFDSLPDEEDDHPWYDIGSGWVDSVDAEVISGPVIPPYEPPPDDPPPDDTLVYTVTAEKTLARFIHSYNAAGKPIFQIYPGDSNTEGRFRYDSGALISVWPEPVRGDGGGDYYKMAMTPVPGCDLYLSAADGVLG